MKTKILKLFAAAFLLTGVIIVCCGCGKTFDLNKYLTYDISGYDGYGVVDWKFDNMQFMADLEKAAGNKKTTSLWDIDPIYAASSAFSGEWTKEKNLSNGDEIAFTWELQKEVLKEIGVTLNCKDVYVTVSGLKKAAAFNPFEHVTISVEGISSHAELEIQKDLTVPEMQRIDIEAEDMYNLSNGDVVLITASITGSVDDYVKTYNNIVNPAELEYHIEGLPVYMESISDVDKEGYDRMDERLRKYFVDFAEINWTSPDIIKDIELVGNYFLKATPGNDWSYDNRLYYVYKVTLDENGSDFVYYWYGYYEDAINDEEGKSCVDVEKFVPSKSSSFFGIPHGDYLSMTDSRYFVAGFKTLDDFFDKIITPELSYHEYSTNIK